MSTRSTNDDCVLSLREFAALAGISIANLRRQIRVGTGPVITRMSERRVGVRIKHARAWLDARTVASEAA